MSTKLIDSKASNEKRRVQFAENKIQLISYITKEPSLVPAVQKYSRYTVSLAFIMTVQAANLGLSVARFFLVTARRSLFFFRLHHALTVIFDVIRYSYVPEKSMMIFGYRWLTLHFGHLLASALFKGFTQRKHLHVTAVDVPIPIDHRCNIIIRELRRNVF